jgi:UDP-N-acetylbacillosamine alanyltransferase
MFEYLNGLDASELMEDVYFRSEFIKLYAAPDPTEIMSTQNYRHGTAIRAIPGTDATDLETPHGYGGPVTNTQDIGAYLNIWRNRQKEAGHVAEFIRLHPFVNAEALRDYLDYLAFNRKTVIVNLATSHELRRKYYSKGTRHALKAADKKLTIRRLKSSEWSTLQELHETTLVRNGVPTTDHSSAESYRDLMALNWTVAWVAELNNIPVATACFLSSNESLCHYHFAGGGDEARTTNANYLLLETAFEYFSNLGHRWMHLGGGRTDQPDDALFKFKSKFSPDRAAYFTGGIIFSREKYEQLGGAKNGMFLGYRTAN